MIWFSSEFLTQGEHWREHVTGDELPWHSIETKPKCDTFFGERERRSYFSTLIFTPSTERDSTWNRGSFKDFTASREVNTRIFRESIRSVLFQTSEAKADFGVLGVVYERERQTVSLLSTRHKQAFLVARIHLADSTARIPCSIYGFLFVPTSASVLPRTHSA